MLYQPPLPPTRPVAPYRYHQARSWHQNKRSWKKDLLETVMAGRVPATHAPAGVPRPWRPHRLKADGQGTPYRVHTSREYSGAVGKAEELSTG